MTEIPSTQPSRILTRERAVVFSMDILNAINTEGWKDAAYADFQSVDKFVSNGINMIREFERAALPRHPEIHIDTDVVYIDSGPGPYSYKMLEPGHTDLDDVNYQKLGWSRKMDRARINAAYALTAMITAKRIEEDGGESKKTRDLTPEDFEKYSPYLMYASVDWQQNHIDYVRNLAKESGLFKIPDSKIITYREFTNRQGEVKPIIHTEDQIEGLHFPPFEGKAPPRRIVIVSHPAHLMRIIHILGKYPESIPNGTMLQLFPIPTPMDAVTEYAKAELLGTLGTVFRKGRASLAPYTNYEI